MILSQNLVYVGWVAVSILLILTVVLVILALVKKNKRFGHLTFVTLILMIIGTGCNMWYTKKINQANKTFKETAQMYQAYYGLLNSGKQIDKENVSFNKNMKKISKYTGTNVGLVSTKKTDTEDYQQTKVKMQKSLKKMKQNDTGKYNLAKYQHEYKAMVNYYEK